MPRQLWKAESDCSQGNKDPFPLNFPSEPWGNRIGSIVGFGSGVPENTLWVLEYWEIEDKNRKLLSMFTIGGINELDFGD